ncbi:MAG: hypothetical protein PHG48_03000 [Eubacteriales bacterium]|nr:hypothetical protein [Eubacteriales bacterium]
MTEKTGPLRLLNRERQLMESSAEADNLELFYQNTELVYRLHSAACNGRRMQSGI